MLNASGQRRWCAWRSQAAESQTDGQHTLTIDGDRIVDASGAAVDGDGDGAAGGDAVETFFRLYGDRDGDRDVEDDDLAVWVDTLSKRSGGECFLSDFDFNGNDQIDRRDMRRLLAKFALDQGQ